MIEKRSPNPLKLDPSRTKMLRERFMQEVRRRFNRFRRELYALVVEEDAFGWKQRNQVQFNEEQSGGETTPSTEEISRGDRGQWSPARSEDVLPTRNTRWRFMTNVQQLEAFGRWAKNQLQTLILLNAVAGEGTIPEHLLIGTVADTTEAWLEAYIAEAYRKGLARAYDDVTRPTGIIRMTPEIGQAFQEGGKLEFLRKSFGGPVGVGRVKLLASRAYSDLNGVTEQLATTIQKELVDGMVQGLSPREVGGKLNKVVDGYKNRGLTIARTETIRAHAEGQLDAMEDLGVEEIGVMVEWSTRTGTSTPVMTAKGNPSPCPKCAPMAKVVLKTKEAHGLLPRHPNCVCSFVPANVGESTTGQKRSQMRIKEAIERSLRAEIPKKSKRSVSTQRKRSSWVGAGKTIAKKRPRKFRVSK